MNEAPGEPAAQRSSKTLAVVGGLVSAATLACAVLAWRTLGPPPAAAPRPSVTAAAVAPAPASAAPPRPSAQPIASAAPLASAPSPPRAPRPSPEVSFIDALTSDSCPAPCSGGLACADEPRECASGFTCIQGEHTDGLPAPEDWTLYLSAVLVDGSHRACNTSLAKGSVCFTPASSASKTCVPIADACAHRDRGTVGVDVTTEDLTHDALTVEVTNAAGAVVASRSERAFADGLRRSALCIGARMRDFTSATGSGPEIESVTFFLAPAGAPLPPRSAGRRRAAPP